MSVALALIIIPVTSIVIGMAYANKRGAHYRPEYAMIG